MSLAAPSRAWGLFGLFPRHHVSHLCRFLSQSGCGCRVFLLTAGPPALRYPLLLSTTYTPVSMSCFNSLTIRYLWRPVPLTATIPLPIFSVLATPRYDKLSGHPGDKESISRWKRGQQMWVWVPSCCLWALIFRQINLSKPQPFLMQNGSERV